MLRLRQLLQRRNLRIEASKILLDNVCQLRNFHGPVIEDGLSLRELGESFQLSHCGRNATANLGGIASELGPRAP